MLRQRRVRAEVRRLDLTPKKRDDAVSLLFSGEADAEEIATSWVHEQYCQVGI